MAKPASDKQIALIKRLFNELSAHKGVPEVERTLAPHADILRSILVNGTGDSYSASKAIDAMINLVRRIESGLVDGAKPVFRAASPAQQSFIASLLADRVVPADMVGTDPAKVPAADASSIITRLKAAPKVSGKAAVSNNNGAEHGDVFVTADKDLLLVRMSRSSGNLYASIAPWPTSPGRIRWDYLKNGMPLVRKATKITAEEAAALGHVTHHCCFCGIELSDEGEGRSVEVGYGPVCASNRGLPWG